MANIGFHGPNVQWFPFASTLAKNLLESTDLDWITNTRARSVSFNVASIARVHTAILVYRTNESLYIVLSILI